MKQHAKAPSAGSTLRQANRLGRIAVVAAFAFVLVAFLGISASSALAAAPSVSVEVAEVGFTSAEAKGTIDPGGSEASYHYEYVTDAQFNQPQNGGFAEAEPNGQLAGFNSTSSAGSAEPAQLGVVTGPLAATTLYHLRLVAEGPGGNTVSSTTFETQPATAAPVTIDPVGTPAYTTIHAFGTVAPEGGNVNPIGPTPVPIAWEFQVNREGEGWVPAGGTPAGGSQVIESAEAESASPVTVEEEIEGLAPGAEYEIRLRSFRAGLEAVSAEPFESFTTLTVSTPVVSTDDASSLTDSSAHFSGQVTAGNSDPSFNAPCNFEYITEAAFQKNVSKSLPGFEGAAQAGCNVTPEGAGPTAVEAEGTELEPHQTYHLRLSATNQGGTTAVNAAHTFTTTALPPVVETHKANNLSGTEATLQGWVNPRNSQTTYWFLWGTEDCSANPCQSIPLSEDADAGLGNQFNPAHQVLTGLEPETTYHYLLVAKNSAGTTEGEDRTLTTLAAGGSSCPNEAARAEQHSTFLPDCRAYEMVSPPDKHGNDIIGTNQIINVAANESPNLPAAATFASFGAFADARGAGVETEYVAQRDRAPGTQGWSTHATTPKQEPVSLAGNLAFLPPHYFLMSEDLTKGIFRSWSPLTDAANVADVPNFYTREDLRSPGEGSYRLLTNSFALLPPVEAGTSSPIKPWPVEASADFRHVLFEDRSNLTADAIGPNQKLYKSDDGIVRLVSDGTGECPGIGGGGSSSPCSIAGLGAGSFFQTPHVISADGSRVNFTAPVVRSGKIGRVGPNSRLYQLDDRGTPSTTDDAVVQVNASERSVPDTPQPAFYQTASADGSRVFFTSNEQLTDSPNSGLYMWKRAEHDETQSLAVDATGGTFALTAQVGALEATTDPLPFDASAAQVQSALEGLHGPAPTEQRLIGEGNVFVTGLTSSFEITFQGALEGVDVAQLSADASALTGGASTATIATPDPVHDLTFIASLSDGAIGASEDGRRLYFASSEGALVPGAPHITGTGLYLWQDVGGAPSVSFVGADKGGAIGDMVMGGPSDNWSLRTPKARVSPDGRHLAFLAGGGSELAPGYRHGLCGSNACLELYVYSAEGSTPTAPDVACASCDLADPGAEFETNFEVNSTAGLQGAGELTPHMNRVLSDDGRRVFFSTDEPLVPYDTNGKFDAYEYDVSSGTVHLLSGGTGDVDSYFMDSSADGNDAYIATRQPLVGWDHDSAVDLYDVRVGGGFSEPPAPPTAPCEGETCRAAYGLTPAAAPIGSGQQGPGNPKPKPSCPKGKKAVKSRGKTRCVVKKHRQAHRRTARANRGDQK